MDFWEQTSWFAVQSKPFQENLASAHVSAMEIEVFLPKVRQEQNICGVIRRVTKPVFQGYFFARFCPLLLLDGVRYASGVLRVVGSSRYPIPVPADIVLAIRARVQADGFIRFEAQRLRPGDKVAIEQGPFAGWMGKVEREHDDGRRVLILLDALEQARALIEKRCLSVTAAAP